MGFLDAFKKIFTRKKAKGQPVPKKIEEKLQNLTTEIKTETVETPVVETPVVETPVVETPVVETPVPVVEEPKKIKIEKKPKPQHPLGKDKTKRKPVKKDKKPKE